MPTLRELMSFVCKFTDKTGRGIDQEFAVDLEREIRKAWPAERVYIPPANSRKDPARAEEIRKAAAKLPTGVVAQRLGVSRSYVARVCKK